MSGIWLSMVEYLRYVKGNENSRCVQEGEEVLNAGHIILYGKTEGRENEMKIVALCLQSSAIYSDPHQIVGSLAIRHNKVTIITMTCTCKAGLGGACKHISGVLIMFTRVDLSKMETISATDLKCVWSTQRTKIQEKYRAVPLSEMPCLRDKIEKTTCNLSLSNEEVLSDIASLLPECALSRLRAGRSNADELIEEVDVQDGEIFSVVLDNSCQSILMMKLYSENIAFHSNCCEELYSTLMNEDQDEAIEVPQNSSTWHKMRKFRITGSRCYEIFTYCGKNWNTKAEKYFSPNSFSNKYINHGLKFEDDARHAFVAASGFKVVQCGMVISHSNKWLGYSPDGIIMENDRPVALLEIKCLWNGVAGAIDGTHIFVKVEKGQQDSYIDRYRRHSINLMAICDSATLFTYIFVGFPGSAHDSRVFENSILYKNIERHGSSFYFDDNQYHLIGDSAFALKKWLMTPYRGDNLNRVQKNHNFKLSSERVKIEHAYGGYKGRWRRVRFINTYNIFKAIEIASAACVLHNFCLLNGDVWDEEYVEEDHKKDHNNNRSNNIAKIKRDGIAISLFNN